MNEVPNVNFFIEYVDCLKHHTTKDYADKYFDKRSFYSCNQDYNYVDYVKNGSNEKIDYIDYSGNLEKSHGVFNEKGLLSDQDIKDLKTKMRVTESPIWHGVISFTEVFGNNYCPNYEIAYKLMKTEFPKFFKLAGLEPKNIVWFAGLHENTDNKHIHFSFFEKQPTRTKVLYDKKLFYSDGMINQFALDKFKLNIELQLKSMSADIINNRKDLIEINRKKLEQGVMMSKIKQLVHIFPKTGRLSYDSEDMKYFRPKIDNVVNLIIANNDDLKKKFKSFESALRDRDKEIMEICKRMKSKYENKLLYEKYMKDIYRRLGNQVLYVVKQMLIQENKMNYEVKKRLTQKRIEKAKRRNLAKHCAYLNQLVNNEAINCFREYLAKLDEANYKRLVEEGYIE